jgi:hypothetical protein
VLLLSWTVALVAWPLAWLLLAVAQGIGTVIAGGGWIGVAVPIGLHPWGLVNEPSIAFADTRMALFFYWLAPSLAVLMVAMVLPTVLPVPRSWSAEVGVFQLATACAVLGLGWAPPLGVGDGPAAGLATFWGVSPTVFVAVAAFVGAAVVQVAIARLCGHLWMEPGGPRRSRRLAVACAHALPPAALWGAAVVAQGWAIRLLDVVGAGVVLAGIHIGAGRRRSVAMAGVVGLVVFAFALWAGAPAYGHGKALVWGFPGRTNNVRPGLAVVRLTPLRAPRKPPAR